MSYSTKSAFKSQWLKLRLKGDQRMQSRYIILHTHFSIYSHLREQGYELACFEAANYLKDQPNATIFIKTDHEGFFKSCCQYYAHDFDIELMQEGFELPENFRLMLGAAPKVSQVAC